jgi:hypothetical protein
MSQQLSLAEAGRATNPRKVKVPGATPFIPNIPESAPEYLVVDQPYFNGGKLFEIGERVKSDAPIVKELGSPGRCLMPINHKGPWPPKAFMEADALARKKGREEWIRDLRRG